MNKYRKKMPKEDLKRYAKEITKKTVASDYKRNRVDDPTRISREHEKAVKKHVYDFFDKAFKKYREHEKKKQAHKLAKAQKVEANGEKKENGETNETPSDTQILSPLNGEDGENEEDDEEVTMDMSEDEDGDVNMPPTGGSDDTDESRKRKHGAEHGVGDDAEAKRVKDDGESATPPPPPPPPPPPQESPRNEVEDAHDAELKAAQEALEKENEDAAAMEEAQGPPRGQGQPQAQDQMAM